MCYQAGVCLAVRDLRFRVWAFGVRVYGLGLSGFRLFLMDFGCWVQGLGF